MYFRPAATRRLLILLLPCVLTALPVLAQKTASRDGKKSNKEICITFDELPAARSFGEVDRQAVNYLILDALKRHKVKAAGFIVGEGIEDSFDILGQWLNDGHTLGSMTFTNQDYNYIGIEAFIEDIRRGIATIEPMLSGFGQKKRYFRYPYLHYGTTVEGKKQAALFLADQNVAVVHATVIPEDYLYNLSLDKLGKVPDSAAFDKLLNEYINHVLDELERMERLALDLVKRPVRHILLLRANRLNAVYLDELLGALENAGYKFITLDRALQDKVYSRREAYYGLKGLGYLDMIANSNPDLLPAE
ncbi:MAG TPA: polysaccharide deacetylase family protein [Acidobacteriota bacterium]|nr:polysaccharide deacetylase family protein [Acidobacteriota bacterium]